MMKGGLEAIGSPTFRTLLRRGAQNTHAPLFRRGAEKRAIAWFSQSENQDAPKTPQIELWLTKSPRILG